jgi:hypothetical protein
MLVDEIDDALGEMMSRFVGFKTPQNGLSSSSIPGVEWQRMGMGMRWRYNGLGQIHFVTRVQLLCTTSNPYSGGSGK